jgi:hypothetical protein
MHTWRLKVAGAVITCKESGIESKLSKLKHMYNIGTLLMLLHTAHVKSDDASMFAECAL